MATIALNIPDAVLPRVLDAFAGLHGYQATLPDPANPGGTIPNPESKSQFAKRKLLDHVRNVVIAFEAPRDAETARAAAVAKVNAEVLLS